MTASFTWWNRLEPSPRTPEISGALAARVHDPLWFLARQWQMGEFTGEDAASPAWVTLTTRSAIDAVWGEEGTLPSRRLLMPTAPSLPLMPLERALLEEIPSGDDLSFAVELAETFVGLLSDLNASARLPQLVAALRRRYPLPTESPDEEVTAFLRVCAPRSFLGTELFLSCNGAVTEDDFWRRLGWSPTDAERRALAAFVEHVHTCYGGLIDVAPPAWDTERLRYRACVAMHSPEGAPTTLDVAPSGDGTLDWYSWDTRNQTSFNALRVRRLIPNHLRFRGMPNARFWDFETAQTDFGDVRADLRDLGRLAVLDMALVHGNDWYLIPFQMTVGTACQIESIEVRDVFGGVTPVPRAEQAAPGWSMFSTSQGSGVADFFHLPATAAFTLQRGPTLEEVRFVNDEGANLAWAIEETVTNDLGQPRSARERSDARRRQTAPQQLAPTSEGGSTTPVAEYQLQTEAPGYWYPLVPVRDAPEDPVRLREGVLVDQNGSEAPPDGRLLTERQQNGTRLPLEVRRDAVPEGGVRVLRQRVCSRWLDGQLHVWTARIVLPGASDGVSGLRYDGLRWRNEVRQGQPASE
jgi:hypothetical protein